MPPVKHTRTCLLCLEAHLSRSERRTVTCGPFIKAGRRGEARQPSLGGGRDAWPVARTARQRGGTCWKNFWRAPASSCAPNSLRAEWKGWEQAGRCSEERHDRAASPQQRRSSSSTPTSGSCSSTPTSPSPPRAHLGSPRSASGCSTPASMSQMACCTRDFLSGATCVSGCATRRNSAEACSSGDAGRGRGVTKPGGTKNLHRAACTLLGGDRDTSARKHTRARPAPTPAPPPAAPACLR